jgi:antitoxin HigA-1
VIQSFADDTTERVWNRETAPRLGAEMQRAAQKKLTRETLMSAKVHDPITPGEILLSEFLEPLGISQYRLAQATGLPQTRISEIVHGRRRITPDTGLRLSRALGLSERYWINMQTDYDIETEHDLHEEELRQVEVLVSPEAA